MVNREVDSTSPPIPAVLSRALAAIPPDTANRNPVGTPGGVSGIWPISATVLGSYHPSFRGGDRGSAARLPSPSPSAELAGLKELARPIGAAVVVGTAGCSGQTKARYGSTTMLTNIRGPSRRNEHDVSRSWCCVLDLNST